MTEIKKCPFCGKQYGGYPAISRTQKSEHICPDCGQKQAMTQFYILTGGNYQTPAINEFSNTSAKAMDFILKSFKRHLRFDWGEIDDVDAHLNDLATVNDSRIFSAYDIPKDLQAETEDKEIWIITEADKNKTTVLFPSEY